MKTTLIANFKGGVGKTAVATLLAHYLRRLGLRVLVLDLDHQGNLSEVLRKSGRVAVAGRSVELFRQDAAPMPAAAFTLYEASAALVDLEREAAQHNAFATRLRAFVAAVDGVFDVCLVDTNPNPDIRYLAAAIAADFVVAPIQLNQEAIDGIGELLAMPRVGLRTIRAKLNPALQFVGLLPQLVEATPFQRANFAQIATHYAHLLIWIDAQARQFAAIPKRSIVPECQAAGGVLWEQKKTAARDAWIEIEPSIRTVAGKLHA